MVDPSACSCQVVAMPMPLGIGVATPLSAGISEADAV